MSNNVCISIFPTKDNEGLSLAKLIENKLNETISFEKTISIYENLPGSLEVADACFNSDIVIFDATHGQGIDNYEIAIAPLRYLSNVLIISRNYLPYNFYGIHNLLSKSNDERGFVAYPTVENASIVISPEAIAEWVCIKAEEILNRCPNILLEGKITDHGQAKMEPEDWLLTMAIITQCFIEKRAEFQGEQELAIFLQSYYHIGITASIFAQFAEDDAPDIFTKKLLYNSLFRALERIFSEYLINAKYALFPEGIYAFQSIFQRVKNNNEFKVTTDNISLYLCNLLPSFAMKQFFSRKLSLFDKIKWTILFEQLDRKVAQYTDNLVGIHIRSGERKAVVFFEKSIANAKSNLKLSYASMIRNLNNPKFNYCLEEIIRDEIYKQQHDVAMTGISNLQNNDTENSRFLWHGLNAVNYYGKKLNDQYEGFISHRTSNYNKAREIEHESNKNRDNFIINPGEFTGKNEIFSLYMRFHIMKELYTIITRMERLIIYDAPDFFNSWWTLFELIAFINAKPENQKKIDFSNQQEGRKIDLTKFLLTKRQLFKLERYLLYSNSMILPKEQLAILPDLYKIFPTGQYELTGEQVWTAKIVQCVHYNAEKSDVNFDFDSFINLLEPYHVIFPDHIIVENKPLACPGFLKIECPKTKGDKACVFKFKKYPYSRYIWSDVETAENTLQEEIIYEYEILER